MDRRARYRNATAAATDSLWRDAENHAQGPKRHPSGAWACCGGYGEHFPSCEFATWERKA